MLGIYLIMSHEIRRRTKDLGVISAAVMCLDLASIGFGIGYAIHPAYSPAWDVLGVLLLVAIFGNFLLVYVADRVINRHTPRGNQLNWIGYGVLLWIVAGMIAMLAGNFVISQTYSSAEIAGPYVVVFAGFFGMLAMGAFFAFSMIRLAAGTLKGPNTEAHGQGRDPRRGLRAGVIIVSCVVLGGMVYFALQALAGTSFGQNSPLGQAGAVNGLLGLYSGMCGGFWCFLALGAALFLLKATRRYHRPRLSVTIGAVGLVLSCVLLAPFVATSASVSTANTSFAAAFGANWKSKIPASVENYFMPAPVNIPGFYLGIPPKDCVIDTNVLYYTGTGAESNIRLYFDAYLPPNHGVGLPGANSTILRLHGGAWVIGDKSMEGMMQVDKYLAAQGYCVFDIQYGLSNYSSGSFALFSHLNLINPPNVTANFSIADMMHQIGDFCQYLVAHDSEYGANLSSTFVSGGSAGGQLTCAVALAIASGNYTSYFGTGLTIRGLIPEYPANGMAGPLDQGRSPPAFIDPTLLVTATSPPCLDYHGTQDGLINPAISQELKDAYTNADNPACAIIWLPMAGHGSDLYFSGYYNILFLYYMERFLYLYR
jgi:acetyl esterase/lipase